jgi:dTDP-D-glucose 4,6-dehydratase
MRVILKTSKDIENKPNYKFVKGDIVDAAFINTTCFNRRAV